MMWHGRIILVDTVSLVIDSDVRSAVPSHPRSLNAVELYHAKTWSQYILYSHNNKILIFKYYTNTRSA